MLQNQNLQSLAYEYESAPNHGGEVGYNQQLATDN